MSALGGYFSRSEAGVDTRLLRRLGAQMAQIGPDGEFYEVSTKVGMLLRPFITHDEVRRAQRPTVDHEGFMITFDGWLDNRDEIVTALGSDLPRPNPTVPELVLTVFKRWGIAGFAKLIGNFTFALWDPHSEQLYLTADSLGMRPLYVHLDAERVVWASRARALVTACDLVTDLDLAYLGAFLANNATVATPFRGIRMIPGGQVMIVNGLTDRLHRYWDFDPGHEIHYRCDGDYEAELRHLFDRAVACRTNADGPIFAELSGGIDSSSIVCVADRQLKRRAGAGRGLHTVSYVFDGATSADERPFIRQVENAVGCRSHHLLEEDFAILSKRPPVGFCPDLPGSQICYLARYDQVSWLMERYGSRVLLNGIGGDQAFISDDYKIPLELADLRAQGRPLADIFQAGLRWTLALRKPLLSTLWLGAVRPHFQSHNGDPISSPPEGEWLRKSFLEQYGLSQRYSESDMGPQFPLPSRARQYWRLRDTMRLYAFERHLSHGHFEVRYPYLDRRLLEFALAIPFDQKLRPCESRSIIRRALADRMPSAVLQRRTKAGPTEAFQRALVRERQWMGEMFAKPLLGDLGIMEPTAFRKALHLARHGLVYARAEMHRTVALEIWLRCLAGQGSKWNVKSQMAQRDCFPRAC